MGVFVANVAALVLVLGFCWLGMAWMAKRVHRARGVPRAGSTPGAEVDTCRACEGVGAKRRLGRLEPCPICEGRGVVTSLPH